MCHLAFECETIWSSMALGRVDWTLIEGRFSASARKNAPSEIANNAGGLANYLNVGKLITFILGFAVTSYLFKITLNIVIQIRFLLTLPVLVCLTRITEDCSFGAPLRPSLLSIILTTTFDATTKHLPLSHPGAEAVRYVGAPLSHREPPCLCRSKS